MTYTVTSDRMAWPAGTVLHADDLAGSNIEALVAGGHLAATDTEQTEPRKRRKAETSEDQT